MKMTVMKDNASAFDSSGVGDNSDFLPAGLVGELRESLDNNPADEARWEYWKYTPLTPLLRHRWQGAEPSEAHPGNLPTPKGFSRLELTDGTEQSLPQQMNDATIESAKSVLAGSAHFRKMFAGSIHQPLSWFVAHNIMHFSGGYGIHVPARRKARLHLVNSATGRDTTFGVRHLLRIEDNASADVLLSFDARNKAFINAGTSVSVGMNARLNLFVSEQEDPFLLLNTIDVVQAEGSRVHIFCFTTSGTWVRNNIRVQHRASHCFTQINGLFHVMGQGHVDNHTWIEHRHPDCESHELFRAIVNDKATGVFNGRVHVYPNAQRTNAFQQNNNILIGKEAQVNTKPELEIYADDVKCSHGTTTGQLDEEAMFYLRSRGIPEKQARQILISSFARMVFAKVESEVLKAYANKLVDGLAV